MGTQLPSLQKGGGAPIFGPRLLWQNGWVNEDAAWYGSRPRPRPHCVKWGPGSPGKGAQQPPLYCGHGRPSQIGLLLSSCLPIVGTLTLKHAGRVYKHANSNVYREVSIHFWLYSGYSIFVAALVT